MTQTFNTKRSEPRDPAHLVGFTTIKKVHINKEYANLVPSMTEEVFESLMSSIRESGQHEPITINNKGEVLDGHNRLRVCEKLRYNPDNQPSQPSPTKSNIYRIANTNSFGCPNCK